MRQHNVKIDLGGKKQFKSSSHNVQWITFDKKTKMLNMAFDVNKDRSKIAIYSYGGAKAKNMVEAIKRAIKTNGSLGELINRWGGNAGKAPKSGISIGSRTGVKAGLNGFNQTMLNTFRAFGTQPTKKKVPWANNPYNEMKKYTGGGKK